MKRTLYSVSRSQEATPLAIEGAEVVFDHKVTLFPVELEEVQDARPVSAAPGRGLPNGRRRQ